MIYKERVVVCGIHVNSLWLFPFLQEEQEKEQRRLEEILAENNHKILEAQRKLVRVCLSIWQMPTLYLHQRTKKKVVFLICYVCPCSSASSSSSTPEYSYRQPFSPAQNCHYKRLARIYVHPVMTLFCRPLQGA